MTMALGMALSLLGQFEHLAVHDVVVTLVLTGLGWAGRLGLGCEWYGKGFCTILLNIAL